MAWRGGGICFGKVCLVQFSRVMKFVGGQVALVAAVKVTRGGSDIIVRACGWEVVVWLIDRAR